MFKKVKATTIKEYIDALAPDRQELIKKIDAFIQKEVPSLKPHFSYNMIGYGNFKYTNSKKQVGDWPVISLASQKNYMSLYVCSIIDGAYIAEKHKDEIDWDVVTLCLSWVGLIQYYLLFKFNRTDSNRYSAQSRLRSHRQTTFLQA